MWRRSRSSRSHSASSSERSGAGRVRAVLPIALAAALVAVVAGCSTFGKMLGRKPAPAAGTPAPAAVAAKDAAAPAAPAAPARIAFNHAFHIGAGPTCLDCHEGADTKDKADMPKLEFCMECHEDIDEKKPKEKTVASFLDKPGGKPVWSNVTAQAATIVFSHKTHAAKKVGCAECHTGIEKSTEVTKALFVNMDACTKCHAEKKAPTTCATCHSNAGEGMKPESHDRMWTTQHGQFIRKGGVPATRSEDCTLCHNTQSCRSCHTTEPPRDHSQSWRVGPGHGIAAALDRTRCQTCHMSDTCTACHTENAPRSHRGGWGAPKDRHCVGCHLPLRTNSPEGCAVCHKGTPSHETAPRMPSNPPHRPDFQCQVCHNGPPRLKHATNGTNCLTCHK